MDRRKFKSGISLHKGLRSAASSQSSTKSETASTLSSIRGSQKLSNTELLRRQTRSTTSMMEKSKTDLPVNKSKPDLPRSTSKRLSTSSKSSTPLKKMKTPEKITSPVFNTPKKLLSPVFNTPTKSSSPAFNTPRKSPSLSNSESPGSGNKSSRILRGSARRSDDKFSNSGSPSSTSSGSREKDAQKRSKRALTEIVNPSPPVSQLLFSPQASSSRVPVSNVNVRKRRALEMSPAKPVTSQLSKKRFGSPDIVSMVDSESDEELVKSSKVTSPKVRNKTVETSQGVENNREISQSSRMLAPSRGALSLRRLRTPQKKKNGERQKTLTSPAKAVENMEVTSEEEDNLAENEFSGDKLKDFFLRAGVMLSRDDEPHQLGR